MFKHHKTEPWRQKYCVSSIETVRGLASPYCPGGGGQDWGSFPKAHQRHVRACAHRGCLRGDVPPSEARFWNFYTEFVQFGDYFEAFLLKQCLLSFLSSFFSLFLPFLFPLLFFPFLSLFSSFLPFFLLFSSFLFLFSPLFPFLFLFLPFPIFSPLPDFWCPGGSLPPLPPHWLRPWKQ